jgi:hypothetical protein
MPDMMMTPFAWHYEDAPISPHDERGEAGPGWRAHARRIAADLCYIGLATFGFIGSTLLMVLGLPLFLFFALAGWDIGLLATHIGNFAQHFLSADPEGQQHFADSAKWAFLAIALIVHLTRMPGWFSRLWARLERVTGSEQGSGLEQGNGQ